MKFRIKTEKPEEEKVLEWELSMTCDGAIRLHCEDMVILDIYPDGIKRYPSVRKTLGLPLDSIGKMVFKNE